MKIAILQAGEPRFGEDTDLFLQNLTGFDQADWFCYFWQQSAMVSCNEVRVAQSWSNISREWATNKLNESLPSPHKVAMLDLGNQSEIIVQVQASLACNVDNMFKHFYSLYRADQLRQIYEQTNGQYDLVIRSRPDLALLDKCDLTNIKVFLDQHPNTIIIPEGNVFGDGFGRSINDQFAIALPHIMKIYTDAVNHFIEYIGKCTFAPESLLAHHCVSNGLDIVPYYALHSDIRTKRSYINGQSHVKFGRWA
jgi:hypothetical protein